MVLIQNEYVKATFHAKGAELQSLVNKTTGKEYLWNGDPAYWGKFSPVLFPVVGALKQGIYYADDQEYSLPRHGFARDREFTVSGLSDTEVSFTLKHDEETLKIFPFEFILHLHYRLEGATLSCTYEVSNPGSKTLLFSVGGHPAFAAATNKEISYEDYFLEFSNDQALICYKINKDLISDDIVRIKLEQQRLPLSHELFYEDALVIKTLKSNRISLRNSKNSNGLHFNFDGFPFFGIWSARDADFVCLEPWCGIADSTDHNQHLPDKEGIQRLESAGKWQRTWSVTTF